ncbi:GntR family transcriptional regulator, partial [Kineococcus indalonis]|uniref:GntR family transcriptional regulator n=1 Tax=Kineococcus indalonis TaxID=2696566 RepID=UPI001412A977
MRARDRAYAQLREDVLDGVLAPGAVLAEVEQSVRLGMSRTPVREAFARLVADGLAEPLAGRGLVVSALSADAVTELHEVREPLERQAVRLAARRGDPAVFAALARRFGRAPELLAAGEEGLRGYYALVAEFDAALDAAVGNAHLVQALGTVRTHLVRVRRLARHDAARLAQAAEEHRLIAEAVAAGDAGLAASAVRVHLHRSRTQFLAHFAPAAAPTSA